MVDTCLFDNNGRSGKSNISLRLPRKRSQALTSNIVAQLQLLCDFMYIFKQLWRGERIRRGDIPQRMYWNHRKLDNLEQYCSK